MLIFVDFMKRLLSVLFFLNIFFQPANADYVNADVLNVRTSPGTNHSIVAKLKRNKYVEVIATEGDWVNVFWFDENFKKKSGWVSKKYLSKVSSLQSNVNKNYGNYNSQNRSRNYYKNEVFKIYDYKLNCDSYLSAGFTGCELNIDILFQGSNDNNMYLVECEADLDYLEHGTLGTVLRTMPIRGSEFIMKNSFFNNTVKLKHYFSPADIVSKAAVRNIECRILR